MSRQAESDQASGARRRVGAFEVLALRDGSIETAVDVVRGLDRAEVERLLAAATTATPLRPTINAFVLSREGRHVLVDTGAGTSMGPDSGHLPASLRAARLSPDQIDTVLLTHIHPDHSNGLIDAAGAAVFPNAELVIPREDFRFWVETDPDSAPERFRRNMGFARRATAPYRDRIRLMHDGEALPGLAAVPLPGHTPGHTGWLVQSGGEAMLIWGDIVHLAAIQIPSPDAGLVFDVDAEQARATRHRIFDRVQAERLLIAGAHLDAPGFGHLARERGRFAYVPAGQPARASWR